MLAGKFLPILVLSTILTYSTQGIAGSGEDEAKTIVRRSFEELWKRPNFDLKLASELYAPNYILQGSSGKFVGIEGCERYFNYCYQFLPDLHLTVDDQIAEGNIVVTRWTAIGTHKGKVWILGEPTGRRIKITGINLARLANGKITEEWTYWDGYGILQQIGKVPLDKQRQTFLWGPPSRIKGKPGKPRASKAIVRRYMEVWNQRRAEALDEIMSTEVINHSDGVWKGIGGQKWLINFYTQVFPDLYVKGHEFIAEGDRVAVRWTATGTHRGAAFGVPPTGKRVKFGGITIFRIADGRIVEMWGAWDRLGMLQQIGFLQIGVTSNEGK